MVIIDLKKDAPQTIKSGKVEIDLNLQIVRVAGKVVRLTEEEYDIALMMARYRLL